MKILKPTKAPIVCGKDTSKDSFQQLCNKLQSKDHVFGIVLSGYLCKCTMGYQSSKMDVWKGYVKFIFDLLAFSFSFLFSLFDSIMSKPFGFSKGIGDYSTEVSSADT